MWTGTSGCMGHRPPKGRLNYSVNHVDPMVKLLCPISKTAKSRAVAHNITAPLFDDPTSRYITAADGLTASLVATADATSDNCVAPACTVAGADASATEPHPKNRGADASQKEIALVEFHPATLEAESAKSVHPFLNFTCVADCRAQHFQQKLLSWEWGYLSHNFAQHPSWGSGTQDVGLCNAQRQARRITGQGLNLSCVVNGFEVFVWKRGVFGSVSHWRGMGE